MHRRTDTVDSQDESEGACGVKETELNDNNRNNDDEEKEKSNLIAQTDIVRKETRQIMQEDKEIVIKGRKITNNTRETNSKLGINREVEKNGFHHEFRVRMDDDMG